MVPDWLKIPTEEPSVIFPIDAVLEDERGVYKILAFEKKDFVHKYKVEVLQQKIPLPKEAMFFMDPKIQWLLVLPQNLPHIKRIQ